VRIEFVTKDKGPRNLLAEAELFFPADGTLHGLKLTGFAIWRGEKGLFVTFPARSYIANGSNKFFDYLRPAESGEEGKKAGWRLKDAILDAYKKHAGISGESTLEDSDAQF
jgi:hypothetical protein